MNVNVNSVLDIGSSSSIFDLQPGLRGLFIPPIRSSRGNWSGKDGGYMSSQFYAPRTITVPGGVTGNGCEEIRQAYCDIQAAVPIRQLIPFVFTDMEGEKYYTDVYLIDFQMDLEATFYADFQLTFYAPDPYFYKVSSGDEGSGGWVEQEIFRIIGGGYPTPYVLPVVWEPGSSPTVITNPNDLEAYPQIRLEGKFTNPRITNGATGQYIEIGVSTSGGDVIIIDSFKNSVTLNGVSILPSVSSGGFWRLVPGDNPISLTSSSSEDDGTAFVRYRIPYVGAFSC